MEAFFDVVGAAALIFLILIGAVAGYIASRVTLGPTALYVSVGIVAAVAAPFVLAALGLTALAAGGLILILALGTAFSIVVLAIVAGLRRDAKR
ncbi:GlsB/YeaQ/YmgE family stress response membrane protein [Roseibacterium sp. SDUM158017]|uniref:GlsB/YeaQ/YmgE family stress response membrane protein n=1 Tax=Roseicyclus salinarum TaxID=3036773 RepID=UPI0024153230|nr:GlsB/YeaQ/YmgE family stress response membrane protein [Roseibacterium sp. SDUM158017]MDG4647987.1 GlsB/YeaQ/YmgE family stress response membrane protein [Roseibacterium sp. SDUM158017]